MLLYFIVNFLCPCPTALAVCSEAYFSAVAKMGDQALHTLSSRSLGKCVCVCVCMCDCSVNLSIISLTLNCPLEMSKGSIKLMLSPTSQIVKYHTQSVTLKLHFHCSFSFSYVRIQFVSVCFSWMCIFVCMHECIISTIITFTLTLLRVICIMLTHPH